MHPAAKLDIARPGVSATCLLLVSLAAFPSLHAYLNVSDANLYGADLTQLQRAHEVHPRNTQIGIELALGREREGNSAEAEYIMLEAARYNRQYLPAWTLANFYFRHQDPTNFWLWAGKAADMCFDDFQPLLRLALYFESDPTIAAIKLGGGPRLLRSLMDVLIGEHRLEEASRIAKMLALKNDTADRDRLLSLEQRLKMQP